MINEINKKWAIVIESSAFSVGKISLQRIPLGNGKYHLDMEEGMFVQLQQFYAMLLDELRYTPIERWKIELTKEEPEVMHYDRATNVWWGVQKRTNESFVEYILAIEQWELDEYFGRKPLPEILTSTFRFKGFAPDSCLAWIFLLARLQGVKKEEFPQNWVTYVSNWNKGDVRSTGIPTASWATLLSSIGHEYYASNGKGIVGMENRTFIDTMTFTLEILLAQIEPSNVIGMDYSALYNRAKSIMAIEEQEYEALLEQAEKVQLELPFSNSNRKILVDALFMELPNALGTIKNFARTDSKHTYFSSGFALMSFYNPTIKGTGFDVTVSIDPSIDSHLSALQLDLEHLETKKWADKRPHTDSRAGFVYNQPWFISNDKSFIGAPQTLKNGEEGRKLSWPEVMESVWSTYNPVQQMLFHPFIQEEFNCEKTVQIFGVPVSKIANKHFFAIKWTQANRGTTITPTLYRYLAAKLQYSDELVIAMHQLADESSFEVVDLYGGKAIVSNEGLVLIDDWTNKSFPIRSYKEDFEKLTKRANQFQFYLQQVREYAQEFNMIFKGSIKDRRRYEDFVKNIVNLKINIRQTVVETMFEPQDIYRKELKNKIEHYWGLEQQLEELYSSIKEIEDIINSEYERKNATFLRSITVFGLPITIMTTIFQPVFSNWIANGKLVDGFAFSLYVISTLFIMYRMNKWMNR